jgi:hypothetical protein
MFITKIDFMKKILIPIFLVTSLSACDKKPDNQKVMIDEVIAIHDEVMPKMDEIMALKSSLDSASKVSPDSVKARQLSTALETADNEMMDWMEEYNPDLMKGKSNEEITKYYADEKAKITNVKTLTDKSIEEAKAFLGK